MRKVSLKPGDRVFTREGVEYVCFGDMIVWYNRTKPGFIYLDNYDNNFRYVSPHGEGLRFNRALDIVKVLRTHGPGLYLCPIGEHEDHWEVVYSEQLYGILNDDTHKLSTLDTFIDRDSAEYVIQLNVAQDPNQKLRVVQLTHQ